VSAEAIRIANGLPPNYGLKVNEVLIIPLDTPTPPTPTPTNTSTPTHTSTPTATPTVTQTPWPDTPTPISGYPAPILLAPPDGQVIVNQDSVLLTWASVGRLADDEWYVVRLRLPSNTEPTEPAWTRTTSWRISADLRPSGSAIDEPFEWQVGVVRLVSPSSDDSRQIESLSPPSDTRAFYWQ
jgi:hypothetical protein